MLQWWRAQQNFRMKRFFVGVCKTSMRTSYHYDDPCELDPVECHECGMPGEFACTLPFKTPLHICTVPCKADADWFHHFPTEVPTRPAAAGPLHAGPRDEVAVLPQWVINSRAFDLYWTNQRQNMIAQARADQHKRKYRGWNLLRIARHICKNKHWLKMSAEGQQAWKNEFANRYPVIALAHGAAGDEEDGGH